MKEFQFRYLKESDYEEWNDFVANSPDGSIYSMPDYLDVLCDVTSAKFKILAVTKNDEIFGGIALYERPSRFGTYVTPRLLLYYNGLVLKDFETKYPSKRTSRRMEIMTALEEPLSKAGYARIAIKNRSTLEDARVFKERGWDVQPEYTYVAPLKDMDYLWERVEQNLRRLINRGSNQGLQFSKEADFENLYHLHFETHQRKGMSLYLPYDKFKRYFERLSSQGLCQLYHARLPEGRPIASQLVLLGPHPISHTVCAGADKEFLNIGANAFLRWNVFKDLSNQGFIGNDLTDASLNPVSHFKSQLGADLEICLSFTRDSFPVRMKNNFNRFLSSGKERIAQYYRRLQRSKKSG